MAQREEEERKELEQFYNTLGKNSGIRSSYSRLDTYKSCPRKYKYQYIEPHEEILGEPLLIGQSVHSALEVWVSEGGEDVGDLIDAFTTACEVQRKVGYISDEEEALAISMLYDYYQQLEKIDSSLVVGIEEPFELRLIGTRIIGFIDRVAYLDGSKDTLIITDYKGLALDTKLPTPTGWTTIEEVQVGDRILGGNGLPCRVTNKSELHYNPCYKITFDDNSSIVCDHEHKWVVNTSTGEKILTTEELKDNLFSKRKKPQKHLTIPTVTPKLIDKELPIDPYVLGAWLGDGHNSNGEICKPLPNLFKEIESRGYFVGEDTNKSGSRCCTRTIFGLIRELRENNLLKNKHIPIEYLRGSYQQRLDLLRGIMDTDGHWNPIRNRCVVTTTNKQYAQEINELVVSLGWKATTFYNRGTGFGKEIDVWQTWFTPIDEEVFLARLPITYRSKAPTKSRRRLITSVVRIDTVPTQCLVVDSIDHTFLCGEQMVKTHNSGRSSITQAQAKNNLQMAIYRMAAEQLWPANHYITELVYPRLHKTVKHEFTQEELDMHREDIATTSLNIKLDTKFRPTGSPVKCGYCSFKGSCAYGRVQARIWEGIKRKREAGKR